jgi:K+-sensing histidine kinase KdpD
VTPTIRRRLLLLASVVAPVVCTLVLVPWRDHLAPANDALLLVVVTVAVSTAGRRGPTFLAALVSAASFDFLLTRPYQSFRITSRNDLTTEVLLLVVGLIVGELAVRSRRHREAADEGHDELARIHNLAEQIAGGEEPDFVVMSVAAELRDLLRLRDCRYAARPPAHKGAWIDTDGSLHLGAERWDPSMGLPTKQVELAVRGGGRTLGTFLLTPTPAEPVSPDRLLVAVALSDQLGTLLTARRTHC